MNMTFYTINLTSNKSPKNVLTRVQPSNVISSICFSKTQYIKDRQIEIIWFKPHQSLLSIIFVDCK